MTVKTNWPALREAERQGTLKIKDTVTVKGKTLVNVTVRDPKIPGGRRPKTVEVID